jgi:hypothetical protein
MDLYQTTLYFESTSSGGSGAETHAESGQTNQALPFTSQASNTGHMSVAGVMPAMDGAAPLSQNLIGPANHFTAAIIFPLITGAAYGGATYSGAFGPITGTGTITNHSVLRCGAVLPIMTGSADIKAGALMEVVGTLPLITSTFRTGWQIGVTLPPITCTCHIAVHETLGTGANFPAIECKATFTNKQTVLNMAGIMPPILGVGSTDVGVELPPIIGSAHITDTLGTAQTWVMNVENHAVTEFSNFSFRAFARAFNSYWGVGFDGNLYKMGGDSDNNTSPSSPIDWEFETGLSDLGTRGVKGVLGIYIDGVVERGAFVTVVTDRNQRFVYRHLVSGDPEDHEPQRVTTGKGIRTGSIGLGMSSPTGAYCEIDSMTPEYVVSNRNLQRGS